MTFSAARLKAETASRLKTQTKTQTRVGSERKAEAPKSPIVAEARANAAAAMAVVRDAQAALATARDAVDAERGGHRSTSRRNGGTSKADARAAALRRYQGNAAKRSPLPPTPTGKENASVSPVRYPSEPRSPLTGNSAAWK